MKMIATNQPIPRDYNARLKNAQAVIFEAIRRYAQADANEMIAYIGQQHYYKVDHTVESEHPGLDGQPQLGAVTYVDFPKRHKIVMDIKKAMVQYSAGSEKLRILCDLYNRVRSLASSEPTRTNWNKLVLIREELKQQVQGVNTIF